MAKMFFRSVLFYGLLILFQEPTGNVTVSGRVSLVRAAPAGKTKGDNSDAVVWLKSATGAEKPGAISSRPHFKILQQRKRFEPHLLAIPAGSIVDFPNLDPFFHNVFSMFDGKRDRKSTTSELQSR